MRTGVSEEKQLAFAEKLAFAIIGFLGASFITLVTTAVIRRVMF